MEVSEKLLCIKTLYDHSETDGLLGSQRATAHPDVMMQIENIYSTLGKL